MSVARMKLVNIVGVASDYEHTVQTCCNGVPFHPELPEGVSASTDFAVGATPNPYENLLKKTLDTAGRGGIRLFLDESESNKFSDQELESYILDISRKQDQILEEIQQTQATLLSDKQVLRQISMMQDLNVNVDELFSCKNAKIRFGRITIENLGKIKLYEHNPFLYFMPFSQDDKYCWCVYFTTEKHSDEIDQLMNSLYFERIRIPDFVHGTPEEAKAEISRLLAEMDLQLAAAKDKLSQLWKEEERTFIQVYDRIRFLHDSFELRRYTLQYRDSFYISGWVEESRAEEFESQFQNITGVDCLVLEPDSDLGYDPPIKLRNNRVFAPFEGFVSLYGMPSYQELDPTPIVAISYMLLFGIMFADIGQGFICILLGLILWKTKKMFLGQIMQRVGVVSMIFGAIFGSVFGNETLLNPVYQAIGFEEKPLEVLSTGGTNVVLLSAICLGVLLILVAMILNVINGIKVKDYGRVLVSSNGLVGIMLYGGTLVGIALMMMFNINVLNPVFISLVIILPLLIIFLKEPLEHLLKKQKPHKPESLIEFFMQNFFELFEVALSFFSNTLSFIRVGAYVLSHAGMMMVVMSIAEFVGGIGQPIVWVLGNLLVMALEGMLVGIQVLRLEFYELFSRFYSGMGRSFEPVKIQYEIQSDGAES